MFQRSVSWLALVLVLSAPLASAEPDYADGQPAAPPTTTPIKYLVVILGENISFDHYFATYPNAKNPPGEPEFLARPDTSAASQASITRFIEDTWQLGQIGDQSFDATAG